MQEVRKIPWRRKQSTSVFLPADAMDRGTWRATVHGVAKSQTRLSTCASTRARAHTHTHTLYCYTQVFAYVCVYVCETNTPRVCVCVMDTVYVCAVRDTWVSSLMTCAWVSLWWAPMCVSMCDGPRACWGLCIKSRLEDKSTWLRTEFCEFGCCFHHMLVMGDLEQAIVPVSLSVKLCWNDHGNHGQCLMSAYLVLG